MTHDDIDALARLLDGDLPEGAAPAEARALGAFAKALEASAATPSFEGKAELRALLVETAREQAARPSLLARMRGTVNGATQRWRYSTRLAAATGASAMALSTGGVAVAAQQAIPGHPLYGVKLALEEGHLLFIGDPVARGEQRLANAMERLEEAQIAAEAGDMDAALRALREADESSRRGAGDIIAASQEQGDPSLLEILTAFSDGQRDRLTALLPLLDGEAADAADDVMVALNRIDQRVAVLDGSCGDCAAKRDAGKNRDRNSGNADTDARDFDFSDIPPASEPFSACPCVSEPTGTAAPGDGSDDKTADGPAGDKPAKKPGDNPPKDEEPADDGEQPGGEEPGSGLPAPVEEVTEEASEIVDDVIDELPVDPPETPDPLPVPTPPLPVDVPPLPGD